MRRILIGGLGLLTAALLCGLATVTAAFAAGAFQVVPSPNVPKANFSELDGVASAGAKEAWTVGFARVGNGPFRALIEHWNASTWSIVASAPRPASHDTRLHGLAAIASNNVWAVGSDNGTSAHSLIEHWNGSSWSAVAGPANEPPGAELKSVAAVSASDIWAVGDANGAAAFATLIEHWNGSAWSVVPGAALTATGHDFLSGVAAAGPNDVWAVGRTSRHPNPVIEHWNGVGWSLVPQPVSGYDSSLNSVSVAGSKDVWAVGEQNLSQTVTEHWDGKSWTLVPSPFPTAGNAQNVLTGVAALSSGDVWAVGLTLVNFSQQQTLAEHWNGSSWSIVPSPSPHANDVLSGVAGSGPGQPLWAVGNSLILEATG